MTNERYYDSRCGHVVALLFSPDLGQERPEMRRILAFPQGLKMS